MYHKEKTDFFSLYFQYNRDTEVPVIFHRWCALAGLGAFLGRDFSLPFGHQVLYPNLYVMLIGLAGTRKSTAIKLNKILLKQAGYKHFAASTTSKEKFQCDLAGISEEELLAIDKNRFIQKKTKQQFNENETFNILDVDFDEQGNLKKVIEDDKDKEPAECFIAADEFNNFFGNNVLPFVSLLGELWDYEGTYEARVKNSRSISIFEPTISILGGNTPTNFNTAFPPEILGQGFFSRMLMVFGEPTGKRITFPETISKQETTNIAQSLIDIKDKVRGQAYLNEDAKFILDKIYKNYRPIEDIRFDSYSNRRFTHLLKLCLIHAAAFSSKVITREIVVYANTVLTYTEHFMPKALGEFGKAKNSGVIQKICEMLGASNRPITLQEIWKEVINDMERISELGNLMQSLQVAQKVQVAGSGFLLCRKLIDDRRGEEDSKIWVDYTLLTAEEQEKIAHEQ